jgi:hypothetical protein
MVTTRSASFTVYAIGEAVRQDRRGNKTTVGQKRLAITFQLEPQVVGTPLQNSTVPHAVVDSYRVKKFMRRTKILLTACFLCALALLRIYGQTPASKLGYIRFWNMLPAANGKFDLRNAGASAGTNLFSGTSYQYASYVGLAVERYHLVVYKSGDQVTPLKSFDVDLKAGELFHRPDVPAGRSNEY